MLRKLLDARGRPTFIDAYLSTLEPATPARWREGLAMDVDPARVGARLWDGMVGELGAPPATQEASTFAADHLYYLPDDLLLKEDRMTMAASVEGRVPFLDARCMNPVALPELPLPNSRFENGNVAKARAADARASACWCRPGSCAASAQAGLLGADAQDWPGRTAPRVRWSVTLNGSAGKRGLFVRDGPRRRWHDEQKHARRPARPGFGSALYPLVGWQPGVWELWFGASWESGGSGSRFRGTRGTARWRRCFGERIDLLRVLRRDHPAMIGRRRGRRTHG
jgi:hypothetical protein